MPRIVECPKCGEDISDSYEGRDESVGIMWAGWYCDRCKVAVEDEWDRCDIEDDRP